MLYSELSPKMSVHPKDVSSGLALLNSGLTREGAGLQADHGYHIPFHKIIFKSFRRLLKLDDTNSSTHNYSMRQIFDSASLNNSRNIP